MMCVTHDLLLARQISEKVIFLEQGVVTAEDTIDHLATHHPDLKVRAFFGREGQPS
jgi:polar amino acid transport system ATP-binding protein